MNRPHRPPGGIIHTYQKYDPKRFPSPTQPPPDLISSAFDFMLSFGSRRRFSEQELAQAIHLDPSQIAGLGPSLDTLIAMLEERKQKILAKFETGHVQKNVAKTFHQKAAIARPPKKLAQDFQRAVREEQIYDLERLWYAADDERSPFARDLLQLMERLGEKYEVDELVSRYTFTGDTRLDVPTALVVKEELLKIDELLDQLREAKKNARLAIIDMEALAEFAQGQEIQDLQAMQEMIEQYVRDLAEHQGLEHDGSGFRLTPQAYRLFQGRLLEKIFSQLQASRTGRHQGPVLGEGAVEIPATKPYEFGDSIAQMDIPQTFLNALVRSHGSSSMTVQPEDVEIHQTRNTPKCSTVVIMDMSGSMRYEGQYINVKRMALALDGLIRSQYPGDYLQFIEMYTFAKLRRAGEIIDLLPKPVTISSPWVRLMADMSREDLSETQIHPHFTNIQHSLQLARQLLASRESANRQIILITDGLPTAHFEGSSLFMLYPPDPRTEEATMREGLLCQREGITINMFLIPSWSQSEEDIRFAHKLAESTRGRVFFTSGNDLDRFVVWDYVQRRREIIA